MGRLNSVEHAGVKETTAAKSNKTLKELYQEFIIPAVESIKSNLVGCFGEERFEFTVIKSNSFGKWLEEQDQGSEKSNETFLKRCLRGVEGADYRHHTAYEVIMHYPELTVSNTHGRSQKIADFFIKLQLNPYLSSSVGGMFHGMRTSFTFAEFSSEYNFSHLQGSPHSFSWSHFCLGHTHFSTLCSTLAIEFNADFFGLFCYQLEQYLSWESLEGGPYKRLENIHERGTTTGVNISSTDRNNYYVEYLRSGHTPNYELQTNPYYYMFKIAEDDSLRQAITAVVKKDQHLQYWNSERKVATDRTITNRSLASEDFIRRYGGRTRLTFKGRPIEFRLTDTASKDEKDDKQKVAHQQIINHIVTNLNKSISKNIKDEFGKTRRVYTAR